MLAGVVAPAVPAVIFRPIRRDRASELVVEQLEASILGGEYQAGDRLPTERDLADRFRTSRSSIREGLRSLEQAGLVVVRRGGGGGAFVAAPGASAVSQPMQRLAQLGHFDVHQLYAARCLLEPSIAAEAATRASSRHLDALEGVISELRGLVAAGQDTGDASHRFHLLIAEATENPVLVLLNEALLEVARGLDASLAHPPRPPHLVVDHHAALLDAVRQHDATAARRLAAEHLTQLGRQTEADRARQP